MDVDVDLRLKSRTVTRCCIDAALSIEFWEKGTTTTVIRIGGRMRIEDGGMRLDISPRKPRESAQAAVLWGKKVAQATGRADGTLDVSFEDGSRLVVPVDPHYEAWEVSADDGFLVVSQPGGRLAIWNPK